MLSEFGGIIGNSGRVAAYSHPVLLTADYQLPLLGAASEALARKTRRYNPEPPAIQSLTQLAQVA